MLVCGCSLAGTRACFSCPQYREMVGHPLPVITDAIKPFPSKKVTEKFDEHGNMIERITEG